MRSLAGNSERISQQVQLWLLSDAAAMLVAWLLASSYGMHTGLIAGAKAIGRGVPVHGFSMWILPVLLCAFVTAVMLAGNQQHLYSPRHLGSILHEQRLSAQVCITCGLLLAGSLYVVQADAIPRSVLLTAVGLATLFLGLRRLVWRLLLYRRIDRGNGIHNVLIVGTGPEAQALGAYLKKNRLSGYSFKGFIALPGPSAFSTVSADEIVGSLETVFQCARKQFVDEILFASACDRGMMESVLAQARVCGVDLRVVPETYRDLAWSSAIEYVGQYPTIALHRAHVPHVGSLFKRLFDVVFSGVFLVAAIPLFLAIAIAVKLDSAGPVFYSSERIGKKGKLFRCYKFRTMIPDADARRADLKHLNERDSVLFKIANDPRVTKLGRFLRKYSLDELPQFWNVLRGEMSVVGPRPPLADEVRRYEIDHLRRLDVTPGITGLWQVEARQDPSFANYVSLDVKYIEEWTFWLDLKIVLRTIGVVFAGTGF
ncbi:MAG: sugar transferase [Acidobacteriota bacterium]